MRGPYDVAALGCLLGLSQELALAFLSTRCAAVLAQAHFRFKNSNLIKAVNPQAQTTLAGLG